jgi:hypothetical protein
MFAASFAGTATLELGSFKMTLCFFFGLWSISRHRFLRVNRFTQCDYSTTPIQGEHTDVALVTGDAELLGKPSVSFGARLGAVFPDGVEGPVCVHLGPSQIGVGEPAEGLRGSRVTADVGVARLAPVELLVMEVRPVGIDDVASDQLGRGIAVGADRIHGGFMGVEVA